MPETALEHWQRPGPTARQRRVDLWIGLAATAVALLNVAMVRSLGAFIFEFEPSALEHYAWALAISLPLIWRRTHPATVLTVVSVIYLVGQIRGAQENQVASGVLFATFYALGAWGRDRPRARWVRLLTITGMYVWIVASWLTSIEGLITDGPSDARGPVTPVLGALVNLVVINGLMFGFAYLAGESAWLAARRQHQLEVQAAELRAAQEQAEERAVFGERVRIARELHDVVAHHVSVMGIQASAARKALDKDVGKTRAALSAVEASARTAVAELRRMLGALRASDTTEPPSAAAGLDRVEELLTAVREAGLTAELTVHGEPRPLPDSVSQAAYRIVQEALTNTLKHAHASAVDVRIRYLARELEIDVADDGRGAASPAGGGMGLIGMRERVAVHDGSIETGPRADVGFRVRVRLPSETATLPAQRTTEPAARP